MAIGFNFDFGREKRIQRAKDLSRSERREIAQEARQRDVTALTAAAGQQGEINGPPLPAFGDQTPERQIQSLADIAQASPTAQTAATGFLPPRAQTQAESLAIQKAEQDLVNSALDEEKKRGEITVQGITTRNLQQYGGLAPAAHGAQMRTIGEFGIGMNNVEDIRTLNRTVGREAIPGAAKGKYDALRQITFNTLRQLTEAGALQKPDIEMFESLLPDFGAFASWSFEQREAQLSELQRQIQLRTQTWVDTTPNAVMPQVHGRSFEAIMGEPIAPDGFEPVEPEVTLENVINRLDEDVPQVGDFLDKVKESFGGSGRFR